MSCTAKSLKEIVTTFSGKKAASGATKYNVVSTTADHDIRPSFTVENVRGGVADYHILEIVSGAVDRSSRSKVEIFDIVSQYEAHRTVDCIDFASQRRCFGNGIADVVDEIGIVTKPAEEMVCL